jgi:hypothetical protein
VGQAKKSAFIDAMVGREDVPELSGEVKDDGTIVLDTKDLGALGRRINVVRKTASGAKKEEKRLRELILAHPDAKLGFNNGIIEIQPNESIEMTPQLEEALRSEGLYEEVLNVSVSMPKVRKVASTNPTIAAALKTARRVGRKVKSK